MAPPERHDPGAAFGLELLEDGSAPFDRELLGDFELALLEVDIDPPKTQDLAPAHSRDQAQLEGGVQPVLGRDVEEPLRFLQRPAQLLGRPVELGRLGQHHGVAAQPAPLHRLLQRHREHLFVRNVPSCRTRRRPVVGSYPP